MRVDAVLPDLMGVNGDGVLEMLMDMTCVPSSVMVAVSRTWGGPSDADHARYTVHFAADGIHAIRNHWCRMWWPPNGVLFANVAPFEPRVESGRVRVGRVLSRPSLDTALATNTALPAHAESCQRCIVIVLALSVLDETTNA